MEHPLISGLEELTLEQLGARVTELHKKLSIAQRLGNGYLCDQLRMALQSYQNKHMEKFQATYQTPELDKKFDDIIDIS